MRLGLIGGSGLEGRLMELMNLQEVEHCQVDTPFGLPSAQITLAQVQDVPVAILQRHGIGHTIPPHAVPYKANIFALKSLGVTHIVATGAVGSLRDEYKPGDLVICDQVIDRTSGRDQSFYDHAAVHVEFADPFCSVLREWIIASVDPKQLGVTHHEGTYVVINGPTFSTRAESEMHRQYKADIVGMTALPEARLAREAEIAYAMIALVTDYDCWRPRSTNDNPEVLLETIIATINQATNSALDLITRGLQQSQLFMSQPCLAHNALRLGIWSDKDAIDPEEIKRLHVLWGRYFESSR